MNRDARWYTAARRISQLIGRTPGGSKIWGGPYTILQVVVFAVTLFILWNTTGLWARFGFIPNIAVGGGVLFGLVWLAGRLPYGMRNPLVILGGWWTAVERATGAARPVRLPPVRRPVFGQVLMITDSWFEISAPADQGEDVVDVAPALAASPDHRGQAPAAGTDQVATPQQPALPALTGVQRLLANATH